MDEVRFDVDELVDAGDRVVAVTRLVARSHTTGLEFEQGVAMVWTAARPPRRAVGPLRHPRGGAASRRARAVTDFAGASRRGAARRRDGVPARGRRRLPAAARPRLAGDEADLVAQHRAAGRGRVRGDRARPARVRRLGTGARRPLRHRRAARATCTRSCTTCWATSAARPPAATSAAAIVQDLGLRFEGFVERQVPLQHRAAVLPDEYEAAGLAAPRSPRDAHGRRLLPPPGPRRRRRWPPSSTRPRSGGATSARCTATASGPRPARSRPRTSTS